MTAALQRSRHAVTRHAGGLRGGAGRLGYVPALDGLRALSVLAVLAYHGGIGWAPGGFVGVEVFFVISGFLITSLLVEEHQTTGRVSLRRFWARRAKRLLPAVLVLLAATAVAALTIARDALAGLRGDVFAALAYATNWRFIYTEQSYFEAAGRPSLVQHLWSLAIEEQFYLLWPIVLAGLLKAFAARRRVILRWVLAGAGVSALLMTSGFDPHDPSRVYYGTDTRASGLLIGAAAALAWSEFAGLDRMARRRPVSVALAFVSVGGLMWCAYSFNEFDPFVYRFGFLLVDGFTVAAIVAGFGVAGVALGCAPLRYVGTRSYALYLWHWPIFQLTRPDLDVDLHGTALLTMRLALTFACAEVSYRVVERPLRRVASVPALLAKNGRVAVAGAAAVGVLASALVFTRPPVPDSLEPLAVPVAASTSRAPVVAPSATLPSTSLPRSERASVQVATTGAAPTTLPASQSTAAPTTIVPTTTVPTTTEPPVPMPPAPVTTPLPATATAYSVFGDSVMLGASALIANALGDVYIDGMVGRLYHEINEPLQLMLDLDVLAPRVLLHLGNNGVVTDDELDEVLMRLASRKRVVIVNLKVPRAWEDINNDRLAAAVKRHRNAVFVDWHRVSKSHPEYFRRDGFHLSADGATTYTALVIEALTKP